MLGRLSTFERVVIVTAAFIAALLVTVVLVRACEADDEPAGKAAGATTIDLPAELAPAGDPTDLELELDGDGEFSLDEQVAAANPDATGVGIHADARDETPEGAPDDAPEQARASPAIGLDPTAPEAGPTTDEPDVEPAPAELGPLGAPAGCPQRFVRNVSSRGGARVVGFVLHYTVSPPGTLDVIRRLFDTPSFQASSHLGYEVESGRCEQWARFDDKAWTQGAFNPVVESVEIIATGKEPRSWWTKNRGPNAGLHKLARLVAARLTARGIPARRVDPVGCSFQLSGWTDHNALECGNTHHDVSPNFPYDLFGRLVREQMRPPCTVRNAEAELARRFPGLQIVVDDRMGGRSREAVRRVQRSKGWPETGLVGPGVGHVLGLVGCPKPGL